MLIFIKRFKINTQDCSTAFKTNRVRVNFKQDWWELLNVPFLSSSNLLKYLCINIKLINIVSVKQIQILFWWTTNVQKWI